MKLKIIRSLMFLIFLGFGSAAQAITLNYSISGNGNGSLGGTSFINTDFTINLLGDTALFNGTSVDPLTSASVSIDGFGTTVLGIPTRLGSVGNTVFFSRAGNSGLDLFDFSLSQIVDLTQSFGPLIGTGVFALNQFTDVGSSLGLLSFDSSSNVTFQASAPSPVPVPAAAWLFGSALLGFFGFSRRKTKA